MKGMKGRFFKKLKFIPLISTSKQGLSLQENFSNENFHIHTQHQDHNSSNLPVVVAGNIRLSELLKVFQDEEMELEINHGDKENLTTPMKCKDTEPVKDNLDVQISSEDVMEHASMIDAKEDKEEYSSLSDFEEKCPPGGSEAVILYTTSLRSIRKTFEDCSAIRFLLQSFHLVFYERDVSMHVEFREELWRILGGRVIPPSLFIKGRYIGGADEVVGLHEQGKLRKLLEGTPHDLSNCPCTGCGNLRFVVCSNCNGSRKVVTDEENGELYNRCPVCNENGLVRCPICC